MGPLSGRETLGSRGRIRQGAYLSGYIVSNAYDSEQLATYIVTDSADDAATASAVPGIVDATTPVQRIIFGIDEVVRPGVRPRLCIPESICPRSNSGQVGGGGIS